MSFLKKKSDNEFILQIHVKPESKKIKILQDDNYLSVSLLSKAVQNRANKELLKLLKKKLKISSNNILLISGQKSKTKIVKLCYMAFEKTNEEEIIKQLLS